MANVHAVFAALIGGEEDEQDEVSSGAHFHELWDMSHNRELIESRC